MKQHYFQDLSKRIIYASLALASVVAIIAIASFPVMKILLSLLAAIIAGFGVWEYVSFAKQKGLKLPRSFLIGLTVLLVLLGTFSFHVFLLLLIGGFFVLFLIHFHRVESALTEIAAGFFGVCYLAFPLAMMLKILYPVGGEGGGLWAAYLIFVTKITDMGAYFGGRLWGKKKLAPHISPGKTIVGSICGLICAMVLSFCFTLIPTFSLTVMQSLYLGAALGIMGQLGDLSESLLKRDANLKDSNTIPGLGGVLDILDSLLFTTPVVYFFMNRGW